MKKISCVVFLVFSLSSCARYGSSGENVFMLSHNAPKLIVPPPLTDACISNFYDLPPQEEDPSISPLPPIGHDVETDSD